jgi:hypothetical protein
MSPVATRALSVCVFVAMILACLVVVTPSLAGISLFQSRIAADSQPPPGEWSSSLSGGVVAPATSTSQPATSSPGIRSGADAHRSPSVGGGATANTQPPADTGGGPPAVIEPKGIHKIKHVIFINQENRSLGY